MLYILSYVWQKTKILKESLILLFFAKAPQECVPQKEVEKTHEKYPRVFFYLNLNPTTSKRKLKYDSMQGM